MPHLARVFTYAKPCSLDGRAIPGENQLFVGRLCVLTGRTRKGKFGYQVEFLDKSTNYYRDYTWCGLENLVEAKPKKPSKDWSDLLV